jgi:hypothetical protein
MKKFVTLAGLMGALVSANALSVNFTPSDSDLGDLDHTYAYKWGVNWTLPTGYEITGATLTISQIYDWRVEPNSLFIHLLDDPAVGSSGISRVSDNPYDNSISDYFSGQGVLLTTFIDADGPTTKNDLSISVDKNTLTSYLTDWNPSGTRDFGFGFDPDCHFYNSGVCFTINYDKTPQRNVPDSASTAMLFGATVILVGALRRQKN